jgi:hypothetical protein
MSNWSCAVCTYENASSRRDCEICQTPRGNAAPTAAVMAQVTAAAPRPAPVPPAAIIPEASRLRVPEFFGLVYRPLARRRRPSIPLDLPLPIPEPLPPIVSEPEITDANYYPVPLESVNVGHLFLYR